MPPLKPSLESSHSTLKMASVQVVKTSVTNNMPSQDHNHPDDHFQSRYVTPGCKPFPERRNFFVIPVPFEIDCLFVFVFFFLRNHDEINCNQSEVEQTQRWLVYARRQQAFTLRHDWFNCLQLYYWSKYLF